MEIDTPTTPGTELVPVTPSDNDNEPLMSEEQPSKRRRKKSIVWEHFTIETVGVGCMRACCKQCKKSFAYITGSKLAGTSHLKRHIAMGICPVSNQKNGTPSSYTPGSKMEPPKKRFRAASGYSGIPFDQESCTHELAKMIIQHEYPLHIVEHPAFVEFVRTLQPLYNMVSLDTIQGECVAVYLREKQNLFNLISDIPGRVSLTLDLGTSNMNIGYAVLTGHFIDGDWNLQRRILNVIMLPFPDSDYAFNHAVASCLSEWHLERRLFTLTLDQSFSNETILGNLRGLLSIRNPFVLNGQLLKGNCYTRVLSRLAQDSLGAMGEVVRRIRESVKYVKTSETHNEKFTELRQQLQVPSTKDLILDDHAKWNTTYEMLVAASELKEVFACLDTSDLFYKINPSDDDWKQVEILCGYLKLFYDAASILTSQSYPPAYAFYHEVSKIQLELTHAAMSQDPFISNLTRSLKEKFDQYWKECFLVLAIAVVMDPRFKMKLVEFNFSKIFGDEAGMWIKIVDDGVHELFYEYIAPSLSLSASYSVGDVGIPQFETPQNPHGGRAVGVPPHEEHMQVVYPESVTSREMHHQEVYPHQGMHTQEVPFEEVASQEMQTQEIPSEEGPPPEMYDQIVPPKDASPQEVQNDEAPPQVVPTEELHSQKMQTDEVPPVQVQTDEVLPQVTTQSDVVPEFHAEETQTSEVPAEEMKTVVPPVEQNSEEVHPQPQETHTEEVLSQELQAQANTEEVPAEATHMETDSMPNSEEAHPEMDTKEVPSEEPDQEMHNEELPPQVAHAVQTHLRATSQETRTDEVASQDGLGQEVHTEEMLSKGVRNVETGELPPQHQEMHIEEAPIQDELAVQTDMQAHSQVTQTDEVPSQNGPPKEFLNGEIPSLGVLELPPQYQEMQQSPSQQIHAQELLPQEMHNQEIKVEGFSQEMHLHEEHHQDLPLLTIGNGLSDFDVYISETANGQHLKSELDQYLEESLLPRVQEFDVLGWWKLNKLKYPTLSKMAADILSIPLSTVAPDSVFDTQNMKVDNYRSSLRPVTLEALICAKDWFQYAPPSTSLSQLDASNAPVKKEF